MAKIKSKKTGKEVEVKDGEDIKDACFELGVPFGCRSGMCGSCMIQVCQGKENLSELTDAEKALERNEENRLACQTKIKEGEVEIDF